MRVFDDVDFPLAPAALDISAFFDDADGWSSALFAPLGDPNELCAGRPWLLGGGGDDWTAMTFGLVLTSGNGSARIGTMFDSWASAWSQKLKSWPAGEPACFQSK